MQIPVRERMIMPRAHLSRDVIERMEKASRKMTRVTRRLGWPWKRFEVVRERVENPEHAANVADFIELVALMHGNHSCALLRRLCPLGGFTSPRCFRTPRRGGSISAAARGVRDSVLRRRRIPSSRA